MLEEEGVFVRVLTKFSSYPPNHILLCSFVKPRNILNIALAMTPLWTSFLMSKSPLPLDIKLADRPNKPSDFSPVRSAAV